MEKHYHHLSTTDRVTLMFLKRQGLSLRAIASELNRSPSTLSRELRRRTVEGRPYDAEVAGLAARSARLLCRPWRKLVAGTDIHEVVDDMLRNKWSPQQISGTLKAMFPRRPELQVSHETVYKAIYAQPHGELRKELIACLRQGHTKRRPVPAGLIVANKSRIWSASTCDHRKSKNGCCLGTGKAT
jgi:IS30 family transposase